MIVESDETTTIRPGLYELLQSPSGDGSHWIFQYYVKLSKPMLKREALRAIFKKLNKKFSDNDSFAYDFNPASMDRLKIIKI